jgi:hypothetical protein
MQWWANVLTDSVSESPKWNIPEEEPRNLSIGLDDSHHQESVRNTKFMVVTPCHPHTNPFRWIICLYPFSRWETESEKNSRPWKVQFAQQPHPNVLYLLTLKKKMLKNSLEGEKGSPRKINTRPQVSCLSVQDVRRGNCPSLCPSPTYAIWIPECGICGWDYWEKKEDMGVKSYKYHWNCFYSK